MTCVLVERRLALVSVVLTCAAIGAVAVATLSARQASPPPISGPPAFGQAGPVPVVLPSERQITPRPPLVSSSAATADAAPVYAFSTVAGTAPCGYMDGVGTATRTCNPTTPTVDDAGNLWFSDVYAIRKVTPDGVVTSIISWVESGQANTDRVGAVARGILYTIEEGTIGKRAIDGTATPSPIPYTWWDHHISGLVVANDDTIFATDSRRGVILRITQDGTTTVLAGVPGEFGSVDGAGATARFCSLSGIALGPDGTLYVGDNCLNDINTFTARGAKVRKVTQAGVVSTLATIPDLWVDDPGNYPVAGGRTVWVGGVDGAGNVYATGSAQLLTVLGNVADATVLRVSPAGVVTTVAGHPGDLGYINGTARFSRFSWAHRVAVASDGTMYVADSRGHNVRKIPTSGPATTLVGPPPDPGKYVDTSDAYTHPLYVTGLAADATGALLFSNGVGTGGGLMETIDRYTPGDNALITLAGLKGQYGLTDGAGPDARFYNPGPAATDREGNLYVLEGNCAIRKVTPDGTTTTLAGNPRQCTDATHTETFTNLRYLTAGQDGSVYAGDFTWLNDSGGMLCNYLIRTVSTSGTVGLLATLSYRAPGGADCRAVNVGGLAPAGSGSVFVAFNHAIHKARPGGVVSGFAGVFGVPGSSDGAGILGQFNQPAGLAVDSAGLVYVADTGNCAVRTISSSSVVSTLVRLPCTAASNYWAPRQLTVAPAGDVFALVAGTDEPVRVNPAGSTTTFSELRHRYDGLGATARFGYPTGVAVDTQGTVYVADYGQHTLRKIFADGSVTTLAGKAGVQGSDDGTGSAARFAYPHGVAVDGAGNVYVADLSNNTIRKVTPGGAVTTIAGAAGQAGSTNGPGSVARFNGPWDVSLGDHGQRLYVADGSNHTIRTIDLFGDYQVGTLAGRTGVPGSQDGVVQEAQFNTPMGLAVDASGTIYVADTGNHTIRMVRNGVVTTLAGLAGQYGPDDGSGSSARFFRPHGLAVEASGSLLVADTANHTIRRVTPSGVVTSFGARVAAFVDGFHSGYRDGAGGNAWFDTLEGIAVAPDSTLYVADSGNAVIRKGELGAPPAFTKQPASQTVSVGATVTFPITASGSPAPTYRWQISTNGGGTWTYLSEAAPYRGTTTTTLTVPGVTIALNGARFRVVASNAFGSATSDAATLSVSTQPIVVLTPAAIRFAGTNTEGTLGPITGAQVVTVSFGGPATSAWTATANQSWVQIAQGSGSGSGTFTVSIINPGNVLGTTTAATALVTVTASSAGNSPQSIPVDLTLRQASAHGDPLGMVDTPAQNVAGVAGSIGVTGWAVDDVGIASVKLYRQWLSDFEPAANYSPAALGLEWEGVKLVYMGEADIVPGARPDVEGSYPTYPQASRAGWGYLLLTNMLPHIPNRAMYGGQGTITIYVMATDMEGKTRLLGRGTGDQMPTTITLTNDAAGKPFGAIDSPGQGQTVSGLLNNWGWALTPDSKTTEGGGIDVPIDGKTIWVWIDGVPVGHPTINMCRGTVGTIVAAGIYCNDDVSNIFGNPTPQPTFQTRTANVSKYRNLDVARGPIGVYTIDTTTLSNGRHSIVWGVTDSAGRVDGIGSRDFIVLNSGADAAVQERGAGATDAVVLNAPAMARGDATALDGFVPAEGEVWGRTGFEATAALMAVPPDEAGMRHVQVAQLGRLELWLGAVEAGYLVANGTLRDLPPGSRLDAATGLFTWTPGAAYFGTYRLTFVRGGKQVAVDVTIGPR